MSKQQLRFERRLWLLTAAIGVPGFLATALLLWLGSFDSRVILTLLLVVIVTWLVGAASLHHRVVFPLQTLSNLLGGLREGDFSTRARGAVRDDALGEVLIEANALAETLREQRLGALEATALLRTVMEELDAAVFAFDEQQRLRLANRSAEHLLRRPVAQLLGRTARELGLADCLAGLPSQTMPLTFPGAIGRFGVRRSSFRQAGRPHQLLVLSDLSRALREEERQAWQRLVRVLAHELNNSLAPIKSLAASLESIIAREPLAEDWREDTQQGLHVIRTRAEALSRFMEAYSHLAKLPPPRKGPVDLAGLIRRLASLDSRVPVSAEGTSPLLITADADQLEQLLINLLRNAAEAVIETDEAGQGTGKPILVWWEVVGNDVEVRIVDTGPGLANSANLFVPFFTTKPKGSGIGLTLCRQIAESHGGSLAVENRNNARGCIALLRLPKG